MLDLKTIPALAKKWLGGDVKLKIIVAVGLLGMLLILIGQFTAGEGGDDAVPENTASAEFVSDDRYAQSLEEKLETLIGSVQGVGSLQVMVTLENAGEYIYAQEEKSSLDKTMDTASEQGANIDYKYDTQNSYVFVDTGYGEKQPLLRYWVPPKVQGVVVVCEGAEDVRVEQSVINVVTTALNIPTTRVCVVKINL